MNDKVITLDRDRGEDPDPIVIDGGFTTRLTSPPALYRLTELLPETIRVPQPVVVIPEPAPPTSDPEPQPVHTGLPDEGWIDQHMAGILFAAAGVTIAGLVGVSMYVLDMVFTAVAANTSVIAGAVVLLGVAGWAVFSRSSSGSSRGSRTASAQRYRASPGRVSGTVPVARSVPVKSETKQSHIPQPNVGRKPVTEAPRESRFVSMFTGERPPTVDRVRRPSQFQSMFEKKPKKEKPRKSGFVSMFDRTPDPKERSSPCVSDTDRTPKTKTARQPKSSKRSPNNRLSSVAPSDSPDPNRSRVSGFQSMFDRGSRAEKKSLAPVDERVMDKKRKTVADVISATSDLVMSAPDPTPGRPVSEKKTSRFVSERERRAARVTAKTNVSGYDGSCGHLNYFGIPWSEIPDDVHTDCPTCHNGGRDEWYPVPSDDHICVHGADCRGCPPGSNRGSRNKEAQHETQNWGAEFANGDSMTGSFEVPEGTKLVGSFGPRFMRKLDTLADSGASEPEITQYLRENMDRTVLGRHG